VDWSPGEQVGQYEIVELIGQGGMAQVYRARHAALNRFVAIKALPADKSGDREAVIRFQREATAIAALEHPNVLAVYDVGEHGNALYLAMQLVTGGSLKERVTRPLEPEYAATLLTQIAGALDYAHDRGVLHRDVKPANILLSRPDWALLSDFGIAKVAGDQGERITQVGWAVGTPEYMSPEQVQALSIDRRADVYSLGVVQYEMLTGDIPFRAATPMATALMHVTAPASPVLDQNPLLDGNTREVLQVALAKDREDRYPTAGDLALAFQQSLAPATTARGRAAVAARPGAPAQSNIGGSALPPTGPLRAARPAYGSRPATRGSRPRGSRGMTFGAVAVLGGGRSRRRGVIRQVSFRRIRKRGERFVAAGRGGRGARLGPGRPGIRVGAPSSRNLGPDRESGSLPEQPPAGRLGPGRVLRPGREQAGHRPGRRHGPPLADAGRQPAGDADRAHGPGAGPRVLGEWAASGDRLRGWDRPAVGPDEREGATAHEGTRGRNLVGDVCAGWPHAGIGVGRLDGSALGCRYRRPDPDA
jgi:tRNA A-37 threonylcarbamoyl transferase component Bud32